jgi:hypothetical protein
MGRSKHKCKNNINIHISELGTDYLTKENKWGKLISNYGQRTLVGKRNE